MGDPQNGWFIIENPSKISFGGIPNSRNVLFLQIFLKHAAKPSAGKPQLGFRELNGRKSCWTWPGSAPKPPRSSPEPSREPCWTFSRTLLNVTWLCTKASQTVSGTFSGTCWTWRGACTSAHRSYSGLKTPLAYAVGEKWVVGDI